MEISSFTKQSVTIYNIKIKHYWIASDTEYIFNFSSSTLFQTWFKITEFLHFLEVILLKLNLFLVETLPILLVEILYKDMRVVIAPNASKHQYRLLTSNSEELPTLPYLQQSHILFLLLSNHLSLPTSG